MQDTLGCVDVEALCPDFSHSLSKCLLSAYCVLGIVLGAEERTVNKTDKPYLAQLTFRDVITLSSVLIGSDSLFLLSIGNQMVRALATV